MGEIRNNKFSGSITLTTQVRDVVAPSVNDITANTDGYNFPQGASAIKTAGIDGAFIQEGLYSDLAWSSYAMPTAAPGSNGQVPTALYDNINSVWTTTWQTPAGGSGATPSLAQVLNIGNTASKDINMNSWGISNIDYVESKDGASMSSINMLNAAFMVLIYNT